MPEDQDFIGTGWSFPVRINARGGIELSRGADDLAESIRLILATPKGQRRMRPAFGCGIHDLAFAPNDPATHGQIRHHVTESLALWEPRIEVIDVRVITDKDNDACLLVEVDYVQRADNQRRNLVYPFYIIPGGE
jgi:phage baseplate assembly protein W